MRNDGSYKPSWFTYATSFVQLDKATDGQRLPYLDPNVRLYAWKRGGETLLSAWTVEGAGNLDLKLGNCHVTDAFRTGRDPRPRGSNAAFDFPVYISKIANPAPIQQLVKGRSAGRSRAARREKAALPDQSLSFDFGSEDKVGTLELGDVRSFTPVLAKEVTATKRLWFRQTRHERTK